MFGSLFLKECKEVLRSITYMAYLIAVIGFCFTQMNFDPVKKPESGQESYGDTLSEDEKVIQQKTLKSLLLEYDGNSYVTYPIGFYKRVVLNDKKQAEMGQIIEAVTGKGMGELEGCLEEFYNGIRTVETEEGFYTGIETMELTVEAADGISHEEFLDYMGQADKLLGGGSSYARGMVRNNGWVPKSYEEALQEYESILGTDQITRAYARLFSDYMGIILGILPVFLAVARQLRDKRSSAAEVIGSKPISSVKLILSRYMANTSLAFLPILALGVYALLQMVYMGSYLNVSVDMFAFIRYSFGWLLPSILFTTAVGFFLTELTNSALAILFQGIFWYASLFMNIASLLGAVGWNLIPRFNSLGEHRVFAEIYPQLVWNRLMYGGAGILLLALTVIVYDFHRKGGKFHAVRRNHVG